MSARRSLTLLLVLSALLLPAAAWAQSQVRVTQDRTTIWQPGFQIVADVVDAGTTLTVVGRRDTFYEVELPRVTTVGRRTGFVAVARVTALDDRPMPASRPPAARRRAAADDPFGPAPARDQAATSPARVSFRVFGQAGVGRFAARQTFETVMGSATAPWFGGGIQIGTERGWLFEVAADRYQDTGRRVFVHDGEVFDLGSETTVRVVPVTFSLGYRFWRRGRLSAYASGGVGAVVYRETSPIASEDENADERFATYQAVVGAEVGLTRSVATAFEAQYSMTPGALERGVGGLYDETDLGVMQVRVKLLFGR